MIDVIEATANQILSQNPDAVIRYRLLRDVVMVPPDSSELHQAKADLAQSACIQELADEQWEDGGWGAFHSRSTLRKQKIPSTEVGVERALALGLDANHPILKKASAYIQAVMRGELAFPDYQEKNDRWLASLELLSRCFPVWVDFAHPSIEWLWEQRNEQGLLDFGPRPSSIAFLPLSDNWYTRQNRLFDWTTRVLILLRKYLDDKLTP